jgi:hypothetical protein
VLSRAQTQNNEEIQTNATSYTKDTGSKVKVLKELIVNTEEKNTYAYNRDDNDWGMNEGEGYDDWYLSSAYTGKINGQSLEEKTTWYNDLARITASFTDFSFLTGIFSTTNATTGFQSYGADTTKNHINDYITEALKAGLSEDEMI